jgi:hypothetical protein
MKKEQIRNGLHILVGAGLGWLLFKTYLGIPIPIQIFYTSFIIGVLGTMWEWGWKMYNKDNKIDYWDVVRAVAAGLVVVIIKNILK